MFYLPTRIEFGLKKEVVSFKAYGKRALVVTGKSSIYNGSLNDISEILEREKIAFTVFQDIEENPSMETVISASKKGQEFLVDFVIGIGGGSPLDAAKAISLSIANPQLKKEELFEAKGVNFLPIIAIPTTSGTGSEVTPYSIITNHVRQTKKCLPQFLFPKLAILEPAYTYTMTEKTTLSTAIDALSHLIESYLTTKATIFSDDLNEIGFKRFKKVRQNLEKRDFTPSFRKEMLYISTLAGMTIAQTSTSLPHGMGYALTYHKKISHGFANGMLMYGYLKSFTKSVKIKKMLDLAGFSSLEDLKEFHLKICPSLSLAHEEINSFAEIMQENKKKLLTHPDYATFNLEDLKNIYRLVN